MMIIVVIASLLWPVVIGVFAKIDWLLWLIGKREEFLVSLVVDVDVEEDEQQWRACYELMYQKNNGKRKSTIASQSWLDKDLFLFYFILSSSLSFFFFHSLFWIFLSLVFLSSLVLFDNLSLSMIDLDMQICLTSYQHLRPRLFAGK
jgi:hypothetical protein